MNATEARMASDKANMFSERMEDIIVQIMSAAHEGSYEIEEHELSEDYVKEIQKYGYSVVRQEGSRFKISW